MEIINSIVPGFWKAASYLVITGIICAAYYFGTNEWRRTNLKSNISGKDWELDNNGLKKYWWRVIEGVLVISVIAFFISSSLGASSDCSNADPVYGGCETIEAFIPTAGQKNETFFYVLFLLSIPFSIGAYNESKKIEREEIEKYQQSDEYKQKMNKQVAEWMKESGKKGQEREDEKK